MATLHSTQQIFEQFLRGELSQDEAVDAIIAATVAHKAAGGRPGGLAIRKPDGMLLSPGDHARAEALMADLDHRASGG